MSATRQRVRHAPSPKKKGGTNWIWMTVIAVVVVVGVGAIFLSRSSTEAGAQEIADEVTVTGDAVPQGEVSGMKAPTVTGVTPQGDPIEIAPGNGQPMIVFGLAHWCGHCQNEVPRLVKYGEEGLFDGVEVYAISSLQRKDGVNWPASAWLEREHWEWPVLADDEKATAFTSLGMSGTPYILAIDGAGTVVARTSGEQPEAVIQQMVDAAKSGAQTSVPESDERSDTSGG